MSTFSMETYYHQITGTLTYLVYDAESKDAVLIDPVADYDYKSSSYSYTSAKRMAEFIDAKGLKLHYVLESHAHADHLTGAHFFKERYAAKVGIGAAITSVQNVFKGAFQFGDEFKTDGSQFDHLLSDGETFKAGTLEFKAIATPGHTPACTTFLIDDAAFVGDAILIEDLGTARCDFPEGSAATLYETITKKLFTLPDTTRIFVNHDYATGGRIVVAETTIGKVKARNIMLNAETSKEEFVAKREARDKTLAPPALIYQSVQFNINGGKAVSTGTDGATFLKMPFSQK